MRGDESATTRRARRTGVLACVVVMCAHTAPAIATEPQHEVLARAAEAEANLDFVRAEALYREMLALDPRSRLGRRARARLGWLDERDDGGFGPLTELERQRRIPRTEQDHAGIARFEARMATFPEGRVRREALQLVAELWLARGHPARALTYYRTWAESPGIDEAERQLVRAGRARALVTLGEHDTELPDLGDAGLADRGTASWVRASSIGQSGSIVAYAWMTLYAALALVWGGWRGLLPSSLAGALSPTRVGLAVYVLAVPVLFAWLYDAPSAHKVAWVCAAAATVVLASAIVGAGLRRSSASELRMRALASFGALAVVGAVFVAMHRSRLLFDLMWSWEQLP